MEIEVSKIWVIIGGVYNLGFAIFHLFFWKIFNWRKELQQVSPANKGIMQVLNIRLIYVFIGFAYLSFMYHEPLVSTELGRQVLMFISVFWFMRAIEQKLFFELRNYVSLAMFVIFLVGGVIYLMALIR